MLAAEKDYFSIRLPARLYSCGTDCAILRMEHAARPWRVDLFLPFVEESSSSYSISTRRNESLLGGDYAGEKAEPSSTG